MSGSLTRLTCPRCQRSGYFDLTRDQDGFACSDCVKTGEATGTCSTSASTRATYNPRDPLGCDEPISPQVSTRLSQPHRAEHRIGMARTCSQCSKQLSRGTRHDLCRACRYPPVAARFCGCGTQIDAKQNTSGYCRRCNCLRNHVGTANERRLEALRQSSQDPIIRKKRGAGVRRYTQTPEGQRQRSEAGKRIWRATLGSPLCRERGQAPEARKKGWETRRRRKAQRLVLVRFRQQDSADFLKKFAPTYRCDDRGRPHQRGSHWRHGNVVLTPEELIERASAKGWATP